MPNYKEPVFIVGMPRSGTTLMQGILCNTGKYFPMPETHFFARAAYKLPENNLSKKNRKRIRRKLIKKSKFEIDREFPDHLTTRKGIFEYLVDQFNTGGADTFLEKTPRHVFFYSKILEYYPDARFLCMIREPKNVVRSQLTNSSKLNKSVIRLSLLYNKIATAILKIVRHENVMLVKYEELTGDTEPMLKHVCGFLSIPYDPGFVKNVAAPPEIVSRHEFWKQKNIRQHRIMRNNPDKWKETLSPAQADAINFTTGTKAAKFGYASTYSRLGLLNGFAGDIGRLLSKNELKKMASIIHG
jgi:hypothetical protein